MSMGDKQAQQSRELRLGLIAGAVFSSKGRLGNSKEW